MPSKACGSAISKSDALPPAGTPWRSAEGRTNMSRAELRAQQVGLYGDGLTNKYADVAEMHERTYNIIKVAADAMAADTSTEGGAFVKNKLQVKAIKIIPLAALTASDTNYATIEV